MTVSGLYEKLKVKIVRVYMVTCLKEEITSDQTVENIETTPPKAPTVHVLAGTPTISFKVRASTFTTPPDSSERNVQSSATSEDFTDIDFLMDSLPDYQDMNLADNLQIMDNESSQPVPSTIEEIRRQRLIFLEGQENRMAPQIETALELNTEERQETLQEILKRLFSKIESDERKNIVNVDRDNVLPCAKRGFQRTSFNENRLLSVRFSGERAIDDGGPTREFIRLAIRSFRDSPIFQGDPHARMLSPVVLSEERGDYKLFGKMLAYFIVIKGTAPVFFSEIMYNALVYGCDACVPTLDDVTDHEIRNQIQKIAMADNNDSFIMATEALIPVIEFIGALPLVTNYANKIQLVHVLCQHTVLTRIKGVLEQFCEGLSCLGLYEELKKYPAVMKTLFVDNKQSLNAVSVDELFDVKFSTVGSNAYMDELRTQTYWRDFLQDLEEENNGLERILVFVTGFDKVPPLGFEPPLQLLFTHPMQEHEGVPFANTCANQLHIPVIDCFETVFGFGCWYNIYKCLNN